MLGMAEPEGDIFDPSIDFLWLAIEDGTVWGAVTTRLTTDKIAELRLVAGARLRDWIAPMNGEIEAWARHCGARKLVTRGRKGWARFNRAFGWAVLGIDDENKWNFEKRL